MKHSIILGLIVLIWFQSCEKENEVIDNDYSSKSEITLPTESPRGLAFDGEYLWYSDDSDKSLYKLSSTGTILETIDLNDCKITGFEFYDNYIWCINDTTVLNDTAISHYPFSCIYKYSKTGERIDSILIQASVNPQYPEFLGITINDAKIFGSSNQGWSSCLYSVDFENEEKTMLQYHYLTGLTTHNDTIFAVDRSNINKNKIVCFDLEYKNIEDKAFEIEYIASDLAFTQNDLWICDRENKILRKIE
jgi:hypothetical protein